MTDKETKLPRLIDRIRQHYATLPESERLIADLFLEFPGNVVTHQSAELAEHAGSSKAAVTRLINRLGYQDFRDLQKEVRDAQINGIPLYRMTSGTQNPQGTWSADTLNSEMQSLQATFASLDQEAFESGVKAALRANRIWTLGFRNGAFFADYVKRQLSQFRPNVTNLPKAGQSIMEELGDATPDDLVIAVGVRRRPPEFANYMRALQTKNVPVLYITDHQAIRTVEYATWTLRCHTSGIGLLDSYGAVMSVLCMYCSQFVSASGAAGRAFNKNIEKWVEITQETDSKN